MIDLNSNEFDVKDVKIFNDGKAGIVNNCTFSVEPKASDAAEKAPDWKLLVIDETGASVNKAFWFLDETHKDFTKHLKYQGTELKSLLQVIGLTTVPAFNNVKDMLNGVMTQLGKYSGKVKVRALVNYGMEGREESYLTLSKYAPYVESMEVPEESSILRQPKNAVLERPKADDNPFKDSSKSGDFPSGNVEDWLN